MSERGSYYAYPFYNFEQSMSRTEKGVFAILEVKNGWCRLKSGLGWIYLQNPKYLIKI